LNNLAWIMATCPEANLRDGAEAVRLAQQACELTGFRRTLMVGTLAAAYAEAGQFVEAVTTAQKACALAAESGDEALVSKNQKLLQLYRAGRPYHETTNALPAVPVAPKP
jgi:protein O-mannosyl-transferase